MQEGRARLRALRFNGRPLVRFLPELRAEACLRPSQARALAALEAHFSDATEVDACSLEEEDALVAECRPQTLRYVHRHIAEHGLRRCARGMLCCTCMRACSVRMQACSVARA